MLGGWVERVGKGSTNIEYRSNISRFIPAVMRGLDKVKYQILGSEQVIKPLIENRHDILRTVQSNYF